MGNSNAQIYNIVSIVFLVLTVLVVVFVVVQLSGEAEDDTPTAADIASIPTIRPTATDTPTATATATATATIPPTFTATPTDTATPTATFTETSTVTATSTITETPGPTQTPSDTPTASISPTPTATPTPLFSPTPTGTATPSESPFFFEVAIGPVFQANTNSAGCAFQAVAGNLLGLDGLEITRQFQIRVIGPDVDRVRLTGTDTRYGASSGWEAPVANGIVAAQYFVRVESLGGTPLTQDIAITFPGTCEQNIAVITLRQTKPFGS